MTRALVFFGTAISFCALADQDAPGQDTNMVIAEIDGTRLTLAQFESRRPSALFQARNTFIEVEKQAIQAYIDDFLVERQAQKENVTVAELLERHVNTTIAKDPDDTALRVYYEGLDTKEPFEAVRDKIIEHIREVRLAKAKTAYIQSLRSQAKISLELEPPRIEISLKNASVRGPADAPLVLVEYADYECPYCQQVQPALDRLEADFKGRMAFVYKDMPLPMHPHAQKAAEASRCAELQGKYWAYHDLLEKNKALEAFTEQIIPGRWAEIRWPTELELKATTVLRLPITEASAKIRIGDPVDDDEDYSMNVWAGVLPLTLQPGEPCSDAKLDPLIEVPDYVAKYDRQKSR